MIQKPSNDLNVIIYNSPAPPKYLKLNKKFINLILWVIPILLVLVIASAMGYSFYFKRQLEVAKSSEPKIIQELRKDKNRAEKKVLKLTSQKKVLLEKISKGIPDQSLELSLFSTPVGMEIATAKKLAILENFTHEIKGNKFLFKFDLKNGRADQEKLSGFIRVIQMTPNSYDFYPPLDMEFETNQLNYNKGESFNASRFRPVIADFNFNPKYTQVWYKVLLFTRSGDLIHYQVIGPYNVQ